jgi:hypothetical protein
MTHFVFIIFKTSSYNPDMCHFAIPKQDFRALLRASHVAAVIVLCIASMSSAMAACNPVAPALLDFFLSGRRLSDEIHGQLIQSAGQRNSTEEKLKSLSTLDHELSILNANVWGLYWVSLYSRRLHEVLDQLDSKPPGPVTQYYDRWDATQLHNAITPVIRDSGAVGALLARTRVLSPALSEKMHQHLGRIDEELRGCPF